MDHFGRVLALGVSWETIKLVFYVFDQFGGGAVKVMYQQGFKKMSSPLFGQNGEGGEGVSRLTN